MSTHAPTRNLVLVGLGAIAVLLGYVGFKALPGHLSASDALYDTVQLFVLQATVPPKGTPWQLDIARFLAPAVLGYAAILAFFTLARERSQALRVRFLSRGHLVIVGLGTRGAAIARQMRPARDVVAIERDASNSTISGLRRQGIPVLVGDTQDAGVLQLARISSASDIVIVTGDDSTNLEGLAVCHRVLSERPGRRPMISVAIDDLGLWRELHELAFSHADRVTRTEFVSFPDRIAVHLVSAAGAVLPNSGGNDHILILGSGPVAIRTAAHAVRRSQASGNQTAISGAGPQADAFIGELRAYESWVLEVADLGTQEGVAPPTVGFVCGLGQASVLAAGADLARRLEKAGTELYVAVPDEEVAEALAATRYVLDRVHLVGAEAEAVGPELLGQSSIELMARARHEKYLSLEGRHGSTAADNPSMVPWDDLPESLKESNRLFADGVAKRLAEVGGSLAPLSGAAPKQNLNLPDDLLENLARAEHDRWVDSLRAGGWRYTDGPKDPERKLQPLLVDWEELSEVEREKDRDAMRSLPMILAAAGYEVVLAPR